MAKRKQKHDKFQIKIIFPIVGIVASLILLLVAPAHFSIALISVIVFCTYSIYAKSLYVARKGTVKAHLIVLAVLLAFSYGIITSLIRNSESSYKATLYGDYIPNFTYQDFSYIYAEIIGSIFVITALYILRRNKKQ